MHFLQNEYDNTDKGITLTIKYGHPFGTMHIYCVKCTMSPHLKSSP